MEVHGKIVEGHGVASGRSGDPRFPSGTLGLQWKYFEELGLDLSGIYKGTINISVEPLTPKPIKALHTFREIRWHPECPAEDFSFFEVRIQVEGTESVRGYIYWPHPETKPEHFQDPHVVEILAPKLSGIRSGAVAQLTFAPESICFG